MFLSSSEVMLELALQMGRGYKVSVESRDEGRTKSGEALAAGTING